VKRARTYFVFLLIFGFLSPAAVPQRPPRSAQTEKTPHQNLLQHEVAVTLKLVQVHVTDPEGNPARDLEISDFVLYDNENLQEITAFEKHLLSPPGVKPEEAEPVPAREAPSAMNRKFLFLLDYNNNDLEGIAKSREVILEFMDSQVQPADEVALISFQTPWRLVVHEDLTLDHQKIRTLLQRPLGLPGVPGGWGSHAVLGQRVTRREIMGGLTPRGGLVSCLQDLAKGLRVVPGQKNILLFSRGIGGDVRDPQFLQMCRDLATANCAVFAVHTITGMEKVRIQAENSLENVSSQTGGKYYPDVNYESKIGEDVQAATSNYYVLGYTIASNGDGKFHEIKVEVLKPGYKVYVQKGYFNLLPFAELSAIEKHLPFLEERSGGAPDRGVSPGERLPDVNPVSAAEKERREKSPRP
jgi:VWFA-related protein